MLPTLGLTPTTDVAVDQTYEIVIHDSDGTRKVRGSQHVDQDSNLERLRAFYGSTPIDFWGPHGQPLHAELAQAVREDRYLTYPPASGVAIPPVEAPVNQVPSEQDFLNHCCTFAHEMLTDFHPHAPRLRHIDSWNTAPDIDLDVDSIQRNRVGMRYYRGVRGYYYDQIVRFGSHPRNPEGLGQFETDWRTELSDMQGLDSYVCGECRDEGDGSRLRDFIHHLVVTPWDNALTAVVASGSGSSLRYTACQPKDRPKQPRRPNPSREE